MKDKFKKILHSRTFRGGVYTTAICVACTALAVAVNLFAGALPTSVTRIDMSTNQLFSLSDETKTLCENIDSDITLYYLCGAGEEDLAVYELLQKYEELSPHFELVEKDPVLYPTFANAYDASDASLGSVIVDGGDKYKVIDATEFYEYELDYDTYTYTQNFAGESALTSAISYVSSDETKIVYELTGHGEADITASTLLDGLSRQNLTTQTLSLLTSDLVPDDAGALLIVSPTKDLSEEELTKIRTYLSEGGKLILITDHGNYSEDSMPNFAALTEQYGMQAENGIIIETDENYALSGYPYYLLPEINGHEITEPLLNGNMYVLTPLAHPITATEDASEDLTVTSLFDTTSGAYCKSDAYSADTFDKSENDPEGVFSVAMISENSADSSAVLWLSTSGFVDEGTDSIVSGTNSDFMLNALAYLTGNENAISIHAKSISAETLLFDASSARLVSVTFMFLIPFGAVAVGFLIWFRRRKR